MHTYKFLFFVLAALPVAAQTNDRPWYKGNLHTHSYWSDGDEFPEMIMNWYKSHGYNFVGLSDHNTLAEGEKWKKITKSKLYEESFAAYLAKYGPAWVTHRTDSDRITVKLKMYGEYKPLFEDKNFLIIQSEEISNRLSGIPIHLNATNIQAVIPPQTGATVAEVLQRSVDAVLKQRAETGVAMFPHVNHPNMNFAVSVDDLIALQGERFFEVYNGHPIVRNYGDSLHPGTEEMWDKINIAYFKHGQPPMYGLATDDTHNYHQFGTNFSNAGRGWVMVRSAALTPESLIAAMESGDFYSTTGVTLEDVTFTGNELRINVKPEPGVRYVIEFVGASKKDEKPVVFKRVKANRATWKVSKDVYFVRARITSSKLKPNPYKDGDYETAWTQPVTFR